MFDSYMYIINLCEIFTTVHHLNAHSMFPLFPENQKSLPQILCGKNLFKNVILQILNFIFGKLNNKKIPISRNANFESVFTAMQRKINITPYWEFFFFFFFFFFN